MQRRHFLQMTLVGLPFGYRASAAHQQPRQQGKMKVTLQPAGKLEEFFLAMAALKTERSQQEIARIFEAHEMKVVGPPLKVG